MSWQDVLHFLGGFLKPTPRHLVPISALAFVVGFLPDWALQPLALDKFAQDYRHWFVVVFLITTTMLAFDAGAAGLKWVRFTYAQRKSLQKVIKRLESLTEDEKKILRFYVFQETRSNILDDNDGVVQGLVSAGIIYRASNTSVEDFRFPYNIQEAAWEHLQKNKSLLDGKTREQRTDQPVDEWED